MFGKTVAQYLDFQKVVLGLIAIVGLARLGLSWPASRTRPWPGSR